MPSGLMSSFSKPELFAVCFSSLMLGLQNLLRVYVVGRQQGLRTQVVTEECEPQTSHRKRNQQVCPCHMEDCREIRLDQPEQIDITHNHEPRRQPDQPCDVTLQRARQQDCERHAKLEDHEEQPDKPPSAVQSSQRSEE